ncbi:MAG: SDR family oxidoreductase [Trichodesmium sp. MAG_R04]|nr:SDR family oxidoreductase [Trichodesmium sp. MAG_R04]
MKIALVTGASRGLGLEWCRQLNSLGYKVILTARDIEKAQESVNKLISEGINNLFPYKLDVANLDQITDLAGWIKKLFGRLDLLINNAGINSATRAKGNSELQQKNFSLDRLETNEILNMLNINAIAPIMVSRGLKNVLIKGDNPKIINIGSWLGSITLKNNGGNYSYAVSKSALNMMNRALAFDLKNLGITTVVVNPGWVQTNMGGSKAMFTPQEAVNNIILNVINEIQLEHTGSFLNYTGQVHPW